MFRRILFFQQRKLICDGCSKIRYDIELLKKRMDEIEKIVNPNKSLTEEVVEHFISPVGLKIINKVVPGTTDNIKQVDDIIGRKINDAKQFDTSIITNQNSWNPFQKK